MMSKTINISLPHHLIPWSNLTKCLISCPAYICDCSDWGLSLEIQYSDIYVHFYCYEQHYICLKRFHYWICAFSLWLQYFLAQQLPFRMKTVVFHLVICTWGNKKYRIKPNYSLEKNKYHTVLMSLTLASDLCWLASLYCLISIFFLQIRTCTVKYEN